MTTLQLDAQSLDAAASAGDGGGEMCRRGQSLELKG